MQRHQLKDHCVLWIVHNTKPASDKGDRLRIVPMNKWGALVTYVYKRRVRTGHQQRYSVCVFMIIFFLKKCLREHFWLSRIAKFYIHLFISNWLYECTWKLQQNPLIEQLFTIYTPLIYHLYTMDTPHVHHEHIMNTPHHPHTKCTPLAHQTFEKHNVININFSKHC